jgi:hypothetical protein
MSWASHNPEKYDELTRKGIVKFLVQLLDEMGYDKECANKDTLEALVATFQADFNLRDIYNALLRLAHVHIQHVEADYWGSQIDAARERGKYNDLK